MGFALTAREHRTNQRQKSNSSFDRPSPDRYDVKMDWSTPLLFLVLWAGGCANEARVRCEKWCVEEKDTCMIEATNADGIQACDRQAAVCSSGCP